MLPGIPVLGLNQINQLVSNRFASYIDSGVSYTYGAYRVTELVFGAVVVQLTTVLLPLLSRELREDPEHAPRTLVGTITLVSFVTLPAAAVMAVLSGPVIGLLFGGGRFDAVDVKVTAATLAAYAFSLVGTGHVKVMATAFFAQKNTRTPMWGSLVALITFTATCAVLVGPWGTVGLGWANTIAMAGFATFLTALYALRYGFRGAGAAGALIAVGRQLAGGAVMAAGLYLTKPWLASIDHTSLDGALRLAAVAGGGRRPVCRPGDLARRTRAEPAAVDLQKRSGEMKMVIQRVSRAEVRVDGEVVGSIGTGLAVLVGLERGDGEKQLERAARRLGDLAGLFG